MAVNFNNPVVTDLRATVLQYIRDYMAGQAKLFDGETLTGTPTGAIRYSTANGRFEKWDGSAWAALSQSYLPLSGGTLTGTLTGVNANFTGTLSVQSNAVWHAGNLNPSNYQLAATAWNTGNFNPALYQLASTAWNSSNLNPSLYQLVATAWHTGNFDPSTKQNVATAWNTSNFDPGTKANLSGATFTGDVTSTTSILAPSVWATGTVGALWFQNRTNLSQAWAWYAEGNIARLYSSVGGDRLTVDSSGNTTLSGTLNCGAITSTGEVTAFSDRRLKKHLHEFALSSDEIASLRAYQYTRTDTDAMEVGLIAQEVRRVVPRAVRENDGGMLSLDYGRFAAVAVVELAREVRALRNQLVG